MHRTALRVTVPSVTSRRGGEGDDGVAEIHDDDPPEEDEIQQLDLAEHGRWKDREGFRPVGVKHEEEGCTDGEKEKFEPADPSP